VVQEFSIEIPDKEADAIHSGMSIGRVAAFSVLIMPQSSKQWLISWHSLMVRASLVRECRQTAADNVQRTRGIMMAGCSLSGVRLD
jgi:hypothetical protein